MSNTWLSTLDVIGSDAAVTEFIADTLRALHDEDALVNSRNSWLRSMAEDNPVPLDEIPSETRPDGLTFSGMCFGATKADLCDEVRAESCNYPALLFVLTTHDPEMLEGEARSYTAGERLSTFSLHPAAYRSFLTGDDDCASDEVIQAVTENLATAVTEPGIAAFFSMNAAAMASPGYSG